MNRSNWHRLFALLVAITYSASFFFGGCKPEKTEEPEEHQNVIKSEDLLGQHTGICFYHHKNFASVTETWDTTHNAVLEFKKVDGTYTSVIGCGGNNNILLPGTIDSVFFYSGFVGGQSYYWEIEISAIDKTIKTEYKVTTPNGAPVFEEYTGKWNL